MERGGHQVNIVERNAADDKHRGGVQGRQRNAFACAKPVTGSQHKGVHGLDRFGFPVRDVIGVVLFQTKMFPDIHAEVVLVAFITEEGVAPADRLLVDERFKPGNLPLLGR